MSSQNKKLATDLFQLHKIQRYFSGDKTVTDKKSKRKTKKTVAKPHEQIKAQKMLRNMDNRNYNRTKNN